MTDLLTDHINNLIASQQDLLLGLRDVTYTEAATSTSQHPPLLSKADLYRSLKLCKKHLKLLATENKNVENK